MNETFINTAAIDWEKAQSHPSGALQKVLQEGGEGTPRVILLKIEPGWLMEEHAHIHTELHYVLEGEYKSREGVYPAGTFRMIPRHTNHGPFSTASGAVILVMWLNDAEG